jgi:hypothetical protein
MDMFADLETLMLNYNLGDNGDLNSAVFSGLYGDLPFEAVQREAEAKGMFASVETPFKDVKSPIEDLLREYCTDEDMQLIQSYGISMEDIAEHKLINRVLRTPTIQYTPIEEVTQSDYFSREEVTYADIPYREYHTPYYKEKLMGACARALPRMGRYLFFDPGEDSKRFSPAYYCSWRPFFYRLYSEPGKAARFERVTGFVSGFTSNKDPGFEKIFYRMSRYFRRESLEAFGVGLVKELAPLPKGAHDIGNIFSYPEQILVGSGDSKVKVLQGSNDKIEFVFAENPFQTSCLYPADVNRAGSFFYSPPMSVEDREVVFFGNKRKAVASAIRYYRSCDCNACVKLVKEDKLGIVMEEIMVPPLTYCPEKRNGLLKKEDAVIFEPLEASTSYFFRICAIFEHSVKVKVCGACHCQITVGGFAPFLTKALLDLHFCDSMMWGFLQEKFKSQIDPSGYKRYGLSPLTYFRFRVYFMCFMYWLEGLVDDPFDFYFALVSTYFGSLRQVRDHG